MKYSQYKFKFYINANHAIYLGGVLGENHPHTWEIILDTLKVRDEFVQFDIIEKKVDEFFNKFQNSDINTIPPFDSVNPTLENLTQYFADEMKKLLTENGWILSVIEVSETPARSYIIDMSDETDELKNLNVKTQDEELLEFVEKKVSKL